MRIIALGLIFLKYISDAFEAKHKALRAEDAQAAEDKDEDKDEDEYLADNIFWVPKEARWSHLQANAKRLEIGLMIDEAMRAIEKDIRWNRQPSQRRAARPQGRLYPRQPAVQYLRLGRRAPARRRALPVRRAACG